MKESLLMVLCWVRIMFGIRNYKSSKTYDEILKELMSTDFCGDEQTANMYWIDFKISDTTVVSVWNGGIFYAWLSKIRIPNTNSQGYSTIETSTESKMPSRKMTWEFLKYLRARGYKFNYELEREGRVVEELELLNKIKNIGENA